MVFMFDTGGISSSKSFVEQPMSSEWSCNVVANEIILRSFIVPVGRMDF